MKKLCAIVAFLSSNSLSVFAADLPSDRLEYSSMSMWTGYYAGLNAGGSWANNNSVNIYEFPSYFNPAIKSNSFFSASTIAGSISQLQSNLSSGFIGGGQLGYNQQVMTNIVIGLETDIQGIAGENKPWVTTQRFSFSYYSHAYGRNNTTNIDNIYSASKSVDYIGTVRGRLGYLITPNILAYASGGLAYGGVNLSMYTWQNQDTGMANNIGPGSSSRSETLLGWVGGGGIEWMFLKNWSAKIEYLYYDLGAPNYYIGQNTLVWNGSLTVQGIQAGQISLANAFSTHTRFNGNIARAGINYHFNFDSLPVIAKF